MILKYIPEQVFENMNKSTNGKIIRSWPKFHPPSQSHVATLG